MLILFFDEEFIRTQFHLQSSPESKLPSELSFRVSKFTSQCQFQLLFYFFENSSPISEIALVDANDFSFSFTLPSFNPNIFFLIQLQQKAEHLITLGFQKLPLLSLKPGKSITIEDKWELTQDTGVSFTLSFTKFQGGLLFYSHKTLCLRKLDEILVDLIVSCSSFVSTFRKSCQIGFSLSVSDSSTPIKGMLSQSPQFSSIISKEHPIEYIQLPIPSFNDSWIIFKVSLDKKTKLVGMSPFVNLLSIDAVKVPLISIKSKYLPNTPSEVENSETVLLVSGISRSSNVLPREVDEFFIKQTPIRSEKTLFQYFFSLCEVASSKVFQISSFLDDYQRSLNTIVHQTSFSDVKFESVTRFNLSVLIQEDFRIDFIRQIIIQSTHNAVIVGKVIADFSEKFIDTFGELFLSLNETFKRTIISQIIKSKNVSAATLLSFTICSHSTLILPFLKGYFENNLSSKDISRMLIVILNLPDPLLFQPDPILVLIFILNFHTDSPQFDHAF